MSTGEVPPETPLSGDFWADVAQFWAENWGIIVGKLVAIAIIIAIAFLVRWILHFVIERVVDRIVTGVKRKQDVTDTQALAQALETRGCAAIHVSSGGTTPAPNIPLAPGYQVPLARAVKQVVKVPVIAVDLIAWMRLYALTGTTLAKAEPKTLRYRTFGVPARLVHARRYRWLRLPRTWPRATDPANAIDRIRRMPMPAT